MGKTQNDEPMYYLKRNTIEIDAIIQEIVAENFSKAKKGTKLNEKVHTWVPSPALEVCGEMPGEQYHPDPLTGSHPQ